MLRRPGHQPASWQARRVSRAQRSFLPPTQDLNIGGRFSNAQFQYTIQSEDLQELNYWAPRIQEKLRTLPELRDVNTDQQDQGLASGCC